MQDLIEVQKQIRIYIATIAKHCKSLPAAIEERAQTTADYDKAIAVATITLKDEGQPATLIPALAKGRCSEERFKMLVAEGKYKAAMCNIESAKASLNGWQSINRYLESV